ncbi:MAG: Ldh family oxidoreductase [Acidimicrobiales bacterium]
MNESRLPAARLEQFCARVFEAVGVSPDHAAITGRRLVEADNRGRSGHGLIRLAPYVERIEAGGVNLSPEITVLHETPTSAQLDGDNGLGQVIMTQATEIAITKAKASGMAWVGTVHSNHAGAAGIYPLMAAREGLIAIYFAVANANGMPPWGGTRSVLGTNPISIAVPAGPDPPFLLDIATTVASHGSIKVAAQAGEQMPIGWVIDADGEPITDPTRAHEGFLMPIGGYKGSGLNIAIGLLAGVMNGAAFGESVIDHRVELETPTNTGQAIFVLRADLFMPAEDMHRSVAAHLDQLRKACPPGGPMVRLPGDRAAEVEAENAVSGVPVSAPLLIRLNQLAERLGLDSLPT